MAHPHCDGCFRIVCKAESSCPFQACPFNCGAFFHDCKLDEHIRYTCPSARVPCINAGYGCELVLPRSRLGGHLAHCPANIIHCRFAHDRNRVDDPSNVSDRSDYYNGCHYNEEDNGEYIDKKALQEDLKLVRDGGNMYGNHSDVEEELFQISLECHPGEVITNPQSKSSALKQPLPPRCRVCITASVPKYHHIRGKITQDYYSFPCNEIVRRDEFNNHWRDSHTNIQSSLNFLVERCPMRGYGCPFGIPRLTPSPRGSSLDYLHRAKTFAIKFPSGLVDEPENQPPSAYTLHIKKQQELALYGYADNQMESHDVLGQLPAEILMNICWHLDSLGLWNLSLVNHYLRSVCFNVVKQKGIVYSYWQKNKLTGRWEQEPKRWSFSRVFHWNGNWRFPETQNMCSHMTSHMTTCPYMLSQTPTYDPDQPWQLPSNTTTNLTSTKSRSIHGLRVF